MPKSVVRSEIDRLAKERGWFLLGSLDQVPATVFHDGFVVAAVGWSGWDGLAVDALALHLADVPSPSVAVFNIDDSAPEITASRLPGVDVRPFAVPVIARYVHGTLIRVEQGWSAVVWMQELGS